MNRDLFDLQSAKAFEGLVGFTCGFGLGTCNALLANIDLRCEARVVQTDFFAAFG